MASVRKGGTFVPNPLGYREVMNGQRMLSHCQSVGNMLAAEASGWSANSDFVVDSMQGLNRIHTRVTTARGDPSDPSAFFRERHYGRDLGITAGSQLGGTFSTRTLGSALKAASSPKSTWKQPGTRGWTANTRGWKSIAGDRLAYSVRRSARRR